MNKENCALKLVDEIMVTLVTNVASVPVFITLTCATMIIMVTTFTSYCVLLLALLASLPMFLLSL